MRATPAVRRELRLIVALLYRRLTWPSVIVGEAAGQFGVVASAASALIYSLAVDTPEQGSGVGRALMQALLERMPGDLIGLYGAVEIDRPDTIAWYRRQGIYIEPTVSMILREGETSGPVKVTAFPGQVFFHGFRDTVRQHLHGTGHPGFADRIARQRYREQIRQHRRMGRPRGDSSYRQFASWLAQQPTPRTCIHAPMGPRPLTLLAWDPELTRVCPDCQAEHLQAVQAYDASDHCDGCQRTRPDIEVSWATDEPSMLIVHVGLCGACRANLPDPTRTRP